HEGTGRRSTSEPSAHRAAAPATIPGARPSHGMVTAQPTPSAAATTTSPPTSRGALRRTTSQAATTTHSRAAPMRARAPWSQTRATGPDTATAQAASHAPAAPSDPPTGAVSSALCESGIDGCPEGGRQLCGTTLLEQAQVVTGEPVDAQVAHQRPPAHRAVGRRGVVGPEEVHRPVVGAGAVPRLRGQPPVLLPRVPEPPLRPDAPVPTEVVAEPQRVDDPGEAGAHHE